MAQPFTTDQEKDLAFPKENRHVYNGDSPSAPIRTNRPFRKRRVSTFNLIFLLFLLALVSVLYISNIIAVNQLVVEVEDLKTAFVKVENLNEILLSEVNRKSGMERITRIATKQLNMQYPKHPPIWLEVDEEKLRELPKN